MSVQVAPPSTLFCKVKSCGVWFGLLVRAVIENDPTVKPEELNLKASH